MADFQSLVEGSEKLISSFGSWPSFHDARVDELHFWRGNMTPGPWKDGTVFPILTVKLVLLEATQPGASHAGNDIIATFRFHDVTDFKMDGFNHLNRILDLSVTLQERGELLTGGRMTPWLVVVFERADGIGASFRCFRIEVVDVDRPK